MKKKINKQILGRVQSLALSRNSPYLETLHTHSYKLLTEFYNHITKKFNNILIDGIYPEMMLPAFKGQHIQKIDIFKQHWRNLPIHNENKKISLVEPQQVQESKYDLIISSLRTHHEDCEKKLNKYSHMLNPDGALISSTWTERTLEELRWAYLMAENQRSGGFSPKVIKFPSQGTVGHILTTQKYQMPTLISQRIQLEFESVVDLLTLLQEIGQTGYLHGRRKGVYKDVLLAMSALYDTQFQVTPPQSQQKKQKQDDNRKLVKASLQMAVFIGWKHDPSQPKPLKRGQQIDSSFFEFMKKQDPDLKVYQITQGVDEPQQIDKFDL